MTERTMTAKASLVGITVGNEYAMQGRQFRGLGVIESMSLVADNAVRLELDNGSVLDLDIATGNTL